MIDHRQITFDPAKRAGVTLIQEPYIGLGILGEVQGGLAIASLAEATPYEAIYYRPDEGTGPRFYIPNCSLRVDPAATADARRDPPIGSLIIAPSGHLNYGESSARWPIPTDALRRIRGQCVRGGLRHKLAD